MAALSLAALFIILVWVGEGGRGIDAPDKTGRVLSLSGWMVASAAAAILGGVGLLVAGRLLNAGLFVLAWYAVSQIAFAIMLGAVMGPLNEFTLLLLLALTYAVGGVLCLLLTRSIQKAAP
jgi:hypothetical protein